jgi:UDP-N-acetylmuramate--alanine ligase
LIEAKKEPTVIVGSLLNQPDGTKSNFIAGSNKYFVVEACEYRRSFLNLKPTIAIITNIDNDHLDYYKDIDDIISAFVEFASQAEIIICNPEDENIKKMLNGLGEISDKKVVDYLRYYDPKINLRVPGEHNRRNAAVALAVADVLGVSAEEAKQALKEFFGTWRRFEYKGTLSNGTIIYDDYAHHPTEIQATLAGARELFPNKRIIAIFQPHLFSRTKLLLDDFAQSFENADKIYIAPIYAAREQADESINSAMVVGEICQRGGNADLFKNFNLQNLGPDDVLITLGAGDIYLHTARILGL